MFDETMKLVLGWSIVGAFVITTAFTLMSLVGWIRFAHRKQQQGLYAALVIEIVVGSVGGLRFSPAAVREETKAEGLAEGKQEGRTEGILEVLDLRLAETLDASAPAKREELLKMIDLVEARPGTDLEQRKAELRSRVETLPSGALAPQAAETLRRTDLLRPELRSKRIGVP